MDLSSLPCLKMVDYLYSAYSESWLIYILMEDNSALNLLMTPFFSASSSYKYFKPVI